MPTAIPQNTLDPVQAGATESMFIVPDRTLTVPYIDTAPAEEHTITIQTRKTKDTYIRNDNPNGNYGSQSDMLLYRSSNGNTISRCLLQFDLSPIPPGAEIVSATLSLRKIYSTADIHNSTWHIITEKWEELQATWNNRKTNTPWSTPGGTYTGNYSLPRTEQDNWTDWDATELIRDIINSPQETFGMILTPDETTTVFQRYRTSEYQYEDEIPKLTITYKTGGELPENTPRFFPILFWYPDHPKF